MWRGPGGFEDQSHLQAVITHLVPPPLVMQMRDMAEATNLLGREEVALLPALCLQGPPAPSSMVPVHGEDQGRA